MVAILFFSVLFVVLLLLPRFSRLNLSICASIFQIYTLPLSGFYPSLALVSQFSLTPALISVRKTLLQPPLIFLNALIIMQVISLAWASDLKGGLAFILYEVPFIIIYLMTRELLQKHPDAFIKLIKTYALLSLLPMLTIAFFRLYHSLNIEFLRSDLAKWIINPNTIVWYFQLNHLDLVSDSSLSIFSQLMHFDFGSYTKPRGFFINPNVGAGYAGICALFFYGMGIRYQSKLLKGIAALHWFSIFLTLSVAGILLGIFFPLLIGFLLLIQYRSYFLIKLIGLFASTVVALAFLLKPALMDILIYKVQSRFVFWEVAKSILSGHLLFGLGFGGWEAPYEVYRTSLAIPNILLAPNLPPHNTFIQLTYQSGIVAALLGAAFMMTTLAFCYRGYQRSQEKLSILCIASGIAWVFLQGMGENWGIVGELHILPLFAMMLALVMNQYQQDKS